MMVGIAVDVMVCSIDASTITSISASQPDIHSAAVDLDCSFCIADWAFLAGTSVWRDAAIVAMDASRGRP